MTTAHSPYARTSGRRSNVFATPATGTPDYGALLSLPLLTLRSDRRARGVAGRQQEDYSWPGSLKQPLISLLWPLY